MTSKHASRVTPNLSLKTATKMLSLAASVGHRSVDIIHSAIATSDDGKGNGDVYIDVPVLALLALYTTCLLFTIAYVAVSDSFF